jgi:hypothetical protein
MELVGMIKKGMARLSSYKEPMKKIWKKIKEFSYYREVVFYPILVLICIKVGVEHGRIFWPMFAVEMARVSFWLVLIGFTLAMGWFIFKKVVDYLTGTIETKEEE